MKSCPTCNRTFDDSFTFCLDDGALLSPPFDPQGTEQMPVSRSTAPTEVMNANALPPTKPAVDMQPTIPFNPKLVGRQYAPAYSGQPRKKNVLLWLIPAIGIALLGVLIYSMSGRDNAGETSSSNRTNSEPIPSGGSATPSPIPSAPVVAATPAPTVSANANSQRVNQQSSSTASSSQDDQARAEEKIQSILRRNAGGCKISKVLSVSAERTTYGWKVMARVVMAASGSPLNETAVWNVSEKNGVVAASQLSAEIEHGCG